MQALHQAAMRLADVRGARPRFKTKDLVGLLLSHGARTWRNSLPVAGVRFRSSRQMGNRPSRYVSSNCRLSASAESSSYNCLQRGQIQFAQRLAFVTPCEHGSFEGTAVVL